MKDPTVTALRAALGSTLICMTVFGAASLEYRPLSAQSPAPDLRSASAESFEIAREVLLDTTCSRCATRFSPDGRSLAYVLNKVDPATGQKTGEIRIINLPLGGLRTSIRTPHALRQVIWSPDGARLLALPDSFRDDSAIIVLASREVIPIGRLTEYISVDDEVYWTEPEGVYFLGGSFGSDRFDLGTLTSTWLGNLSDQGFAALRTRLTASALHHPNVVYRVTNQTFEVVNRDGSLVKELLFIYSRPMWFSRDAAYAVIEDPAWPPRGPGEGLRLLVMGTRATPTLVSASIVPLPAGANPRELADIQNRLSRNVGVIATIGEVRKNPLNGRIVGMSGRPKALVQIISVEGDRIAARIVRLFLHGSVADGDILTNFVSPEPVGRDDIKYPSIGATVTRLTVR